MSICNGGLKGVKYTLILLTYGKNRVYKRAVFTSFITFSCLAIIANKKMSAKRSSSRNTQVRLLYFTFPVLIKIFQLRNG